MRRALLVPLVLLSACFTDGSLAPRDTAPDDSGGSHGDDTGMGPCESGLCSLGVEDALAECGDPTMPPASLTATATAPGTLEVEHREAAQGCCPTLLVVAEQDLSQGRIDVGYQISDDDCDCVCTLDFSYTLTGAQPGVFTLYAGDATTTVEIP